MEKLREVKIYVDGRSEEIQKKLFELDEEIKWELEENQYVADRDAPFLYITEKGALACGTNMEVFANHSYTELKADEILAMKPEYEFKPFEQVLARGDETGIWRPDIFLYYFF